MNRTRARVLSVALSVLMVAAAFTVVQVDSASAAEHSFVVEQGDECISVSTLQNDEDVESFFDYRNPYNTEGDGRFTYSTHMPDRFTEAETSRLFLYDGPNGVSLVIVHNEIAASAGDSAATFQFSGLPDSGDWVVVDDDYDEDEGRDDQISRNRIDWSWTEENRTDGGVFRGLDQDGLSLTITPSFNEDASLYDGSRHQGRVTNWQVLSGSFDSPQSTELDMSEPITIRTGTCEGETTTTTTTETPEPTTTTETPEPTPEPTTTPTPEPTTTTEAEPTTTPGGGGGGGSGGGGGGSGGGDSGGGSVSDYLGSSDDDGDGDGGDSDPGSGPSVDVEQVSESSLHVRVEGVDGAETVSIEPEQAPTAAGIEYRALEVAVDTTSDFEFDVSAAAEPPENVSAPTAEQGIEPISYLSVDHPSLDPGAVSEATVRFAVSEEALAERNVSAEQVALFHYADGEWAPAETELVEEGDGTYEYEATAPGLSTFAVGAGGAAISVQGVELSSETVRANEPVRVTATVENAGPVDGTRTVNLTMFDEVVASEEVEVPAGETATVTFEQTVSAPGTYTVQVGNASTELTVEETTTQTTTTTTTENERGQPGFGPVAVLVALLALVAVARRRA